MSDKINKRFTRFLIEIGVIWIVSIIIAFIWDISVLELAIFSLVINGISLILFISSVRQIRVEERLDSEGL